MYDGFKMQLPSYMKQALLNNDLLNFNGKFSHKTGEVNVNVLTANYPMAASKPLLRFIIKNTYIEVVGSFHKYFENGRNCKDYSFEDFAFTLRDMETKFNIKPKECIIHNLEFGLNILLEGITSNEIISNCMLYKTKSFNVENFEKKGKLKRAKLAQYEVKIYDKGMQYSLCDNLLRIEKKIKRMQPLGDVNLERLLQLEFIHLVSNQLLSLWGDVLLYQNGICLSKLGKPFTTLYLKWANPNYVENLIVQNCTKFKYERRKLREAIYHSKTPSSHANIENSMISKLVEFEKAAMKNYTNLTPS